MPKRKIQEPMTVTGRIVHKGPSNSPRCVVEDPSEKERRWVLCPGNGKKSSTGLITIQKGSRLHEFVKSHKYLSFNLVSEQAGTGGGNAAAAKPEIRRKKRNTITNVQKTYDNWKKEKNATRQEHLPKPMDETSMNGPTPKQLLEVASKMSPKAMLGEKETKPVEVIKPVLPPEPIETPVIVEVQDPVEVDQEIIPEPQAETKFAIQPVSERTTLTDEVVEQKLENMEYEDLIDIAVFNSIDMGRTRTPKGILNKIYKHMDETGEGIKFPE